MVPSFLQFSLFLASRNGVKYVCRHGKLLVFDLSTEGLDFIEGFLIASIDSENYEDFFSLIINEVNIIEIECDYGLNDAPDDNPWGIRYDGLKLTFDKHEIYPK